MTKLWRRWALLTTLMLWLSTLSPPVVAHDLRPGAVSLTQTNQDSFRLRLTAPVDEGGRGKPLRPIWPPGCKATAGTVQCTHGLSGELTLAGLDTLRVKVLVHIEHADGQIERHLLMEGENRVRIGVKKTSVVTYFWLGIEHFLLGLDHILFLLGLMLLSTTLWARIVALSMFTLAHGLTMGAATLGLAWAPSPVVELLIAASVLHLAREVIHQERTWTRRAPAAVALGIGLVHGFGFAGVFGELSLPEGEMLLGLGLFHLGLEAGQLLVVLVGWPLWLIASRWLEASSVTRTAGYAIGMAAGVMVVERVASWVQWLSV